MTEHTLTDNDHLQSKVALRLEAIERLGAPRQIRVLDAYHGHGRLWGLVDKQLPAGWSLRMYRADRESRAAGTLKIDNTRLLQAIDLSKFDLIDLDAYGFPAAQLKLVSKKAPGTMVLTTRISRSLGRIPKVITDDLGVFLPKGAPHTLIVTLADELWEAWLYHLGYRQSRLLRFDHGGIVKRYECLLPPAFCDPPLEPAVA